MSFIKFNLVSCFVVLSLVLLRGSAYGDSQGGGAGPLIFYGNDETVFGGVAAGFYAWERPISSSSSFIIDLEVSIYVGDHLAGISGYGGAAFRVGNNIYLGFGPGLLLGGLAFGADDDCETDCVGGAAGLSGFALSGEIGVPVSQDGRTNLFMRAVITPDAVNNNVNIFQIYLGLRVAVPGTDFGD